MDSDRLNKWLTLGANVGVLIGIILLVIELNQNRDMMRSHLKAQGFNSRIGGPGGSRIRNVTRNGGTWVINVRVTHGGIVLSKQHVLYVNARTGGVSDNPPKSSPAQVAAE